MARERERERGLAAGFADGFADDFAAGFAVDLTAVFAVDLTADFAVDFATFGGDGFFAVEAAILAPVFFVAVVAAPRARAREGRLAVVCLVVIDGVWQNPDYSARSPFAIDSA